MPGNRTPFLKQVVDIWNRLDITQRFTIAVFTVLVLAGLGVLVFFMNRVDYLVLYRDLNPEDAQAIATKLKADKRDYLVQGNSILVAAPQTELDKIRLDVAGAGLARSGRVGYEIFDKSQFGMTDFTEQVNLQRALEGELARTINTLSEISEARVHLVLPKDSLFEDKKEDAKASVVVGLKNGAELSNSSIAGIKNLIAGAVPGLHTYNVSIVDEEGKLLAQSVGSGDDSGRAEIESGIREQLEREMTAKVISILEPVVGKGKVHAKASIDLDFNSSEQTEETFNPNPQTVLSQQKSEERMGGAGQPSGVPGTQSNQPGGGSSSLTGPERLRQSEVTNYEVSKLVRHTVQPKGNVRRLSVAVILDHKTTWSKNTEGKIVSSVQPRTQQDLNAYRDLVLAAVGFNQERGDVVTLENVPFFSDVRPQEETPEPPWYVKWQTYLLLGMKYGSFLLLFLLAYFVLFRPIRKRVFQAIPISGAPALAAAHAQESLSPVEHEASRALTGPPPLEDTAAVVSGEAPAMAPVEESAAISQSMDLEAVDDQIERELMKEAQMADLGSRKYVVLKKRLIERAKKDPELISQLIRTWLQEKA